ncbi:MAG TPA: DUF1552 domain-containing protein [Pirellulaceae bacterium]|nr:DUF1552 domain-containing protein [Pirellulaceae bacterium]
MSRMTTAGLPRRTFLKGAGVLVGLPLLEAMSGPAARAAAPARPPVRSAFIFFANGAIMDAWRPKGEGVDYELSATLAPLAPHKGDFSVITGLAQDNGRAKGDGPGDHARSAATFLTGAHPVKTAGADIKVGISADQAIAEKIGSQTRLPSLEIGIERGRQAGSCDSGYSCAYSNSISWKNESTPMAKEIQPRLVFQRLFGGSSDPNAAVRNLYRRSILDLVAEDARRLQGAVGQTDRRKLDEYFTGVRELEQRIARADKEARQSAENTARNVKPDLQVPEGVPGDLQQHIRLMYDLLVLAFQTDSTRVASFMLANEGSNRAYNMVGVTNGHHELSHHRNEEATMAKIRKIDLFLSEQFAYFLEKMKSVKEGEGTLLDNSLILYGSGLSDGNRHRHDDLPIVLAGRGRGAVATGRHVVLPRETPLNNLFLTMADVAGAATKQLGDSTGVLDLS